MKVYHHRDITMIQNGSWNRMLLKPSCSNSSDSSGSSVLFSMCPLSIDSENYLSNDDQSSLVNTDRPNLYKKKSERKALQSFNQSDSLLQVHSIDQDSIHSSLSNLSRKCDNETASLNSHKIKKKLSFRHIMDLLNHQPDPDTLSTNSCLYKLLLQPKLDDEIEPPPCLPVPVCYPISPERIIQCKQRQTELDRAIEKLLETIKYETNKNIQQIFKYWSYIKQSSLQKYQSSILPSHLLDYVLNCKYFNQTYESYLDQNDELKAALQVLSTTLSIVYNEHSFSRIDRLFDDEEKSLRDKLQSQLECLLASYTDELSFIRERIRFYQSNVNETKTFDWIQIIQIDYPLLIEKMSNDFLIQIPQIEQSLVQLIRNTKKNLLNIHLEINANK